jgi:5-deoxy-glucuronate isomerase
MRHARLRILELHGAAEDVSVELLGAGHATRQVNNLGSVEAFEADSLIAVEVLTPGGNRSSHPPHRHDELEEIYYYVMAGSERAWNFVDDA